MTQDQQQKITLLESIEWDTFNPNHPNWREVWQIVADYYGMQIGRNMFAPVELNPGKEPIVAVCRVVFTYDDLVCDKVPEVNRMEGTHIHPYQSVKQGGRHVFRLGFS